MRKISTILVAFLILATVQTAIAAEESINLCQKQINVGGSWGVCNPLDNTIAQGTFTYNIGGVEMTFTAQATSPVSIDGNEFSLIYYKDTDTAHVLSSTKAVNVLATATASGTTVSFSGTWNSGDIPAVDDINPRGKIWIVKTSEINLDGSLKWTGYANGTTMTNYLFESDSIAQTPNDGLTVLQRMGGISYQYIAPCSIELGIGICPQPTIGISVEPNTIDFGYIYPGGSSVEQLVNVTITQTPEDVCANVTLPTVNVEVRIELGTWTSTEMSTEITRTVKNPVAVTGETTVLAGFTATATASIVPGEYRQIITVSATF